MQAILLAGGLGTRLRSVVSDRPKPMALIEGRPFMEYVTRELVRSGIDEIIFAVGYKGTMVEEYFGDGKRFGFASLCYEETLLGTAGAIQERRTLYHGERFFVLNADTFYQIDYAPETAFGLPGYGHGLVLREVPDVSRYGQAILNQDGFLTAFNEKTEEARKGTINGGIYLMRRSLMDTIPEGKVSLENDMIPMWLKEGKALGGFVNDGYFIDIGIPEAYRQFQEDVRNLVVI